MNKKGQKERNDRSMAGEDARKEEEGRQGKSLTEGEEK